MFFEADAMKALQAYARNHQLALGQLSELGPPAAALYQLGTQK